jgi:hypothetical protein
LIQRASAHIGGEPVGPVCAKRPARGPQDDQTADLFAPPAIAQQGHLYDHAGTKVLALATGDLVPVGQMEAGHPWFVSRYLVSACALKPLPMAYFGGEVPR